MKAYLVGGAVRDRLLGQPVDADHPRDRDWVVVGSTPEAMVAAGYTPVGRDFPVFLHPQTQQEYALARTERKSGRGYQGFVVHASPDVTLDQDLARRDLTINAIAEDPATGALTDPFGGQQDLQQRVLRHVGPAFVEDPVRLLRLARFAARFADFSVAPETQALLQQMVADGEVDALVPERVWQELSRGLMEARPDRMFEVLRGCGALARLLPEVDRLWGVPQPAEHHPEIDTGVHLMLVLQQAARLQAPLAVRYASLCHDLGKGTTPPEEWPRHIGDEAPKADAMRRPPPKGNASSGQATLTHEARSVALARQVGERWRVPADCRELAELTAREHGNIHRSGTLGPAALVRLFDRCDAWRRPARFAGLLLACECDARGRLGREDQPYPQRALLLAALAVARAMDTTVVAAEAAARGLAGPAIGQAISAARVRALGLPEAPDSVA